MKTIAYYLPQFHEVEENNLWWGKGFTEWTHVRNANSLFDGHHQPMIPLNGNYYNLLDKKVMIWQTELAKKYQIHGFCYYHYWFSGRKILEKPAENLLQWKDVDQNFCFCWANHSWRKTWDGTRKILIEQTYGDKEEWQTHIQYLLPFFQDERYIKIDNKPVFVIYTAHQIENLDERIQFYDTICKANGLAGIFVIENAGYKDYKQASVLSDAIVLREPDVSLTCNANWIRALHKLKRDYANLNLKPMTYQYSKLSKQSVDYIQQMKYEKRVFFGGFTGWDSTPRHGNHGYVILGNEKQAFKQYLQALKQLSKEEYIFINAWNEWGEGMILEPDSKQLYEKLEAIRELAEKEEVLV